MRPLCSGSRFPVNIPLYTGDNSANIEGMKHTQANHRPDLSRWNSDHIRAIVDYVTRPGSTDGHRKFFTYPQISEEIVSYLEAGRLPDGE